MPPYETSVVRLLTGNGGTAGLGVLIGPTQIVTCAHVVNTALDRPQRERSMPTATVWLEFPLAEEAAYRKGTVVAWEPPASMGAGAGDVAGLEISEAAPDSATPARFSTQPSTP